MLPVTSSVSNEDVTGGIEQNDATGVAKYHGFQERLANGITDGQNGQN